MIIKIATEKLVFKEKSMHIMLFISDQRIFFTFDKDRFEVIGTVYYLDYFSNKFESCFKILSARYKAKAGITLKLLCSQPAK